MAMSKLHNFDIGTRQTFHIRSKASKSGRTESKRKKKCREERVGVGRRHVYGDAFFYCVVLRRKLLS